MELSDELKRKVRSEEPLSDDEFDTVRNYLSAIFNEEEMNQERHTPVVDERTAILRGYHKELFRRRIEHFFENQERPIQHQYRKRFKKKDGTYGYYVITRRCKQERPGRPAGRWQPTPEDHARVKALMIQHNFDVHKVAADMGLSIHKVRKIISNF